MLPPAKLGALTFDPGYIMGLCLIKTSVYDCKSLTRITFSLYTFIDS